MLVFGICKELYEKERFSRKQSLLREKRSYEVTAYIFLNKLDRGFFFLIEITFLFPRFFYFQTFCFKTKAQTGQISLLLFVDCGRLILMIPVGRLAGQAYVQ